MRFASLTMFGVGALLMLGTASCGEEDSKTQLNPDGPPMIRQIFMEENVMVDTDGDGTPDQERKRTQLAFGKHQDIPLEDDPQDGVSNALANNNTIRVIIDELLDGSTMEQVMCGRVEKDPSSPEDEVIVHFYYDDIPSGTDPDDIADCTGVDRSNCTAVCTEPHEPHGDYDDTEPMGVVDGNEDGAADFFRFKEDVVQIACDGQVMPLDLENHNADDEVRTFWNPSGNQQIPAGDIGISGIGPAIVLKPLGLRTGAKCTLEIDDSVVDKDGIPVCAPPDGDIGQNCPGTGDTSLVEWGTQVFALVGTTPTDNQENVKLTVKALLQFNLDVDPATIGANVELSTGGSPVSSTIALESDNSIVSILPDAELMPETEYMISITGGDNGVKEVFGGSMAEDVEVTFTTCLGNGTTCDAGGPCCSGICDPDALSCVACLDLGKACTSDAQCCTGNCGDSDTCEASTMVDAGTPDAGTPDAGTPDAGTPDAM